ncbi:MAG: 16S rRNA (uracil(1498)-N(3))-methyltransferase [Spirochaetes bacterium]|nr:16S rRNA (uracil(1498)-N(3))-methyltransferase [Spirochaetota bacterium]
MPQFFVKSSDIIDGNIAIRGDDSGHLRKVRRVKPGDAINIRVDDGTLVNAVVNQIYPDHITASIKDRVESNRPAIDLTLYAGLLKGKMFDFVLQKATETGVSRIVPVVTKRTVPLVNEKKIRWEKIMENAAKQCMRSDIPVIDNVKDFDEVISGDNSEVRIIAHTQAGNGSIRDYLASAVNKKKDAGISILIGPEGGFTEEEVRKAEENNWMRFAFGFTALRAETAAIVIPAIIIHEWSMLK